MSSSIDRPKSTRAAVSLPLAAASTRVVSSTLGASWPLGGADAAVGSSSRSRSQSWSLEAAVLPPVAAAGTAVKSVPMANVSTRIQDTTANAYRDLFLLK